MAKSSNSSSSRLEDFHRHGYNNKQVVNSVNLRLRNVLKRCGYLFTVHPKSKEIFLRQTWQRWNKITKKLKKKLCASFQKDFYSKPATVRDGPQGLKQGSWVFWQLQMKVKDKLSKCLV